jgi:hypothetical protein
MSKTHGVIASLCVATFAVAAVLTLQARPQAAATTTHAAAPAAAIENLRPTAMNNIESLASKGVLVDESPNSPAYVHIDKAHAVVHPRVPAGDNGALLRADLTAPNTILYITYDCHGSTCPWTYPCDGRTCQGHSIPIESHGDNTATWWGWTNDGNNSEYVFAVHYAAH